MFTTAYTYPHVIANMLNDFERSLRTKINTYTSELEDEQIREAFITRTHIKDASKHLPLVNPIRNGHLATVRRVL